MPRFLTAAKIAEGALRRIGAFSPRDEAPDPDELDVALGVFDEIVQELTGTMPTYWLVPSEFTLPLTVGTASYNLLTALGSSYPENGLQFPESVWLQIPATGGSTIRREVEIIRRRTFLAHEVRDQTGEPREVYIDRLNPPTLSTWPIISLTGYSLILHYQTYAADQTKSGGDRQHGLPAAWQRWAELATAADIGDGPVRRLAPQALNRIKQERELALAKLKGFNAKEHSKKRAVAYRDF